MATTGRIPSQAIPAAKVTACCSAMPASKQRVGNWRAKSVMPDPSSIAGVTATTRGSRLAAAMSHSPKRREYVGAGFWPGGGGAGRAGGRGFFHFQRRDSVKFDRVFFRFGETLPLDSDDVEQLWSVSLAEISQHFGEGEDVVSVHGSDIVESEGLKESAGGERAFDSFSGFFGHFQGGGEEGRARVARRCGRSLRRGWKGFGRGDFAGRRRRGEMDISLSLRTTSRSVLWGGAGVVEGFKSHAAGHGAVADDGGDFAVFALEFCGLGHSKGGGDGGAGMSGAKAVAGAFGAGEESGDSPPLADGLQLVAPSGEDFVGVGLVSDIPDDSVVRGFDRRGGARRRAPPRRGWRRGVRRRERWCPG